MTTESVPDQPRNDAGRWVVATFLLMGMSAGVLTVWWHHVRGQEETRRRAAAHDMLARKTDAIYAVLIDWRGDVAPPGPILQWIDPETKKPIGDGMEKDPWGGAWRARFVTSSELEVVSGGADGAPGGTGDARDVRLAFRIDFASRKATSWIEDVEEKR